MTVEELLEMVVKESTLQADSDESPDSVSSLEVDRGSTSSRLVPRARVSVYKDTENQYIKYVNTASIRRKYSPFLFPFGLKGHERKSKTHGKVIMECKRFKNPKKKYSVSFT